MVSDYSRRSLNLGRYSLVPYDPGRNLQVGSFWKRKHIDDIETNRANADTGQVPKRLTLRSGASLIRRTSSGRGSSASVTPDSLATIADVDREQNDVPPSDKIFANKDECRNNGVEISRIDSSGTQSTIINVDTWTAESRLGNTHESVIVEVDPHQCRDRSTNTSLISESDIATTPSNSAFPRASLQKRKKKYPKKLAYEEIMSGVKFVMSGFSNPKRSKLRDEAIAMGARYCVKWQKDSTHLICAFKFTHKHKAVMAANGRVVREHWIQECSRQKQLLDWRSYKLGDYSYPDSEEEVPSSDDNNSE